MKFFTRKNEADRIVSKIDKLVTQRQKIIDNKNVKNSEITNQTKALEYKAWQNQVQADSKVNALDRQVEKLKRDLKSVKEYVNDVVPSDQKPMNITGKEGKSTK